MLIEFSVSNFRSFRGIQTLSMVAAPRLRKLENTIDPDVDGEKLPRLLKAAAIYGPNASGKSNLISALNFVAELARATPEAIEHRESINNPFRFDQDLHNKPSSFSLHFICNKKRYLFELSVAKSAITHEKLTYFPNGKETVLYERTADESQDDYVFSKKLAGGSELHNVWKKLTGPKSLFIRQAALNSSKEFAVVQDPYSWITNRIYLFNKDTPIWLQATKLLSRAPQFRTDLASFLSKLDVPVSSITVGDFPVPDANATDPNKGLVQYLNLVRDKAKMTLTHETRIGSAEFDISEESEGTINLIGLFSPWCFYGREEAGGILTADELDGSLHPEIMKELVRMHVASKTQKQLIFTTHDTHFMNAKILRRDQFWLTERDGNGATMLRSIHDFTGRESEDIEKRYFEGRYRSLPIVDSKE